MLELIVQSLWFFLPAGLANMIPPLVKKVNILNYPLDFGAKLRGRRVFGENKTWRGLIFGILIATAVVALQKSLGWIMDYSSVNVFLLGFLMGFGALAGDAIESFFKRQANIKPGHSWIPFDQLDWIVAAVLLVNFYYPVSWQLALTACILYGLIHPLINIIGYALGVNKNKL